MPDMSCALTWYLLQMGDCLPCLMRAEGDTALCLGDAS